MVWQDCLDLDRTILKWSWLEKAKQETTGQKKCFSKLCTSHGSRPVLTHVFNTAVTAWDLFVWLTQPSGKNPESIDQSSRTTLGPNCLIAAHPWATQTQTGTAAPHYSLRHYELLSSFQNHTGHTDDTLYSFPKSKRRVNGLLEKANANPINQSLGWHQALS